MSAGNGHVCPTCGSWVSPGMGHICSFTVPGSQIPMQPLNPACRAPWVPLTAADVRLIVREEIEAALTKALGAPTAVASGDSASLPQSTGEQE